MNFPNQLTRFNKLLTIPLLAGAWGVASANLQASEASEGLKKTVATQREFSTPEEAIKALQVAVEAKDKVALVKIFGPKFLELSTGDEVEDANNAKKFALAMAQSCQTVKEGQDKITLEVGTNSWPMPIPLVKTVGQWHFDTAAGKEEIINRHIGKDELHAIGVCRAYVLAQWQYARINPKIGGGANFAQQFKSTPGTKNGLYWPAAENEPTSPFGVLVAQAQAEGYATNKAQGAALQPFHGYYFRILTRQGKAATGGEMNYLSDGALAGGFGLVAYPERWNQSGITTFIVNQDGNVYQRNFGEQTAGLAGSVFEYNPDSKWTLVKDEGVLTAVFEK